MDSSRQKSSLGNSNRVSGGSPSEYGLTGEGRMLSQQRAPYAHLHQQDQVRDQSSELLQRPPKPQRPESDGDGSPPPHLSAATSATSSTPTSSATGSSEAGQTGHSGVVAQSAHVASDFPTSETGSSSAELVGSIPAAGHANTPLSYAPYGFSPQSRAVPSTEQDMTEAPARYNTSISYSSAVKLLVSNNVAGSIIGRSGQTISELQTQSSTRIKLSQSGDFYPTTQDRVCLVQGQGENVKRAMSLLLTRLYALQQQQHIQHFAWQRQQQERTMLHDPVYGAIHDPTGGHPSLLPAFSFVVRLLVPAPCCGMIIGKGGTNIKQMVDNSGVSSVRLSPKEGGASVGSFQAATTANIVSATAERIVTITGPDLNSCLKCIFVILDGMTANPEISRYTNMTTSYSRVISAAQSALAVTPPQVAPRSNPSLAEGQPGVDAYLPGHALQRDTFGIETQFLDRESPHSAPAPLSFSQPPALRGTDVPNFATQPPFLPPEQAFKQTLQRGSHQPAPPNPMYLVPSPGFPPLPPQQTEPQHSSSKPDLLALQMHDSLRLSEPALMDPSSTQQFVPQMPQPTVSPPGFQAQVAIPDSLIGSILGRGGRTLNELQLHSSTRIRISQKGDYVPGTKNRVVTIRGPGAQNVTTAQYLMSQRMVLPPTAYLHQKPNNIDHQQVGVPQQQEQRPQPQPPPPQQYSEFPGVSPTKPDGSTNPGKKQVARPTDEDMMTRD